MDARPAAQPNDWTVWEAARLLLLTAAAVLALAALLSALVRRPDADTGWFPQWAPVMWAAVTPLTALAMVGLHRLAGRRTRWEWVTFRSWDFWLPVLVAALAGFVLLGLRRNAFVPVTRLPSAYFASRVLTHGVRLTAGFPLVAFILAAVGLAPLADTWVLRGILQRALTARWGARVGIGATALVFTLLHTWSLNPWQGAAVLVVGWLLSWVTHRFTLTQSLFCQIGYSLVVQIPTLWISLKFLHNQGWHW